MGKRTTVSVAMAAAMAIQDDAVLRRRVQYKIYQREHRARQKNKTLQLEQDVATLRAEIAKLQVQHDALASARVFSSIGTLVGGPAQVVASFYRVFAFGHDDVRARDQAQYLRSIMAADVRGPDFDGVEAVIDQWQIYGSLFHRTFYDPQHIRVERYDDQVTVLVDVVMTIQPTHRGALILYPNVLGDEDAIQRLVSKPFRVSGSVRFVFDTSSRVTWFGAEMDFVTGMIAVLGSVSRVQRCVEDANMSLSTGLISWSGENTLRRQMTLNDLHDYEPGEQKLD